ncbi:hypothetical protein [Clostridium akagii]|uniref:hypothetical protein n=1 Tax=Clostridium akagii TaxID=91623 RepID=UPI00047E84F4|nr:hypothetical protein [Clostridium akagii]
MKKPKISEVTAYFNSNVESVWNAVTNNIDYKWRSDIEKIEIVNAGKEFIEYTHRGNTTKFVITKNKKYSEYEFNMGNKMFTGFWTGHFSKTEIGGTKVIFNENIFVRNPIINALWYFFVDLKKIQNTYILDLKKKLGEKL